MVCMSTGLVCVCVRVRALEQTKKLTKGNVVAPPSEKNKNTAHTPTTILTFCMFTISMCMLGDRQARADALVFPVLFVRTRSLFLLRLITQHRCERGKRWRVLRNRIKERSYIFR